jgi:hypothetical protein
MVIKKLVFFGALCPMYYCYRQIINKRYMLNYNLTLEDSEVDDLRKFGKSVISQTVISSSPFQKFMNPKKKTVVIYGDGLVGVSQLAYLHSLKKYNLILITEDFELAYKQE